VTNNKYVHTPQGIFELKYFFTPGITRRGAMDISSESVKHAIVALIQAEDKGKPLSDQKIVNLLNDRGILVARRTVAKYREGARIPSSSRRRQLD
jgi:RNA polymerase sigma-54 factor